MAGDAWNPDTTSRAARHPNETKVKQPAAFSVSAQFLTVKMLVEHSEECLIASMPRHMPIEAMQRRPLARWACEQLMAVGFVMPVTRRAFCTLVEF